MGWHGMQRQESRGRSEVQPMGNTAAAHGERARRTCGSGAGIGAERRHRGPSPAAATRRDNFPGRKPPLSTADSRVPGLPSTLPPEKHGQHEADQGTDSLNGYRVLLAACRATSRPQPQCVLFLERGRPPCPRDGHGHGRPFDLPLHRQAFCRSGVWLAMLTLHRLKRQKQ